MNRIKILFVHHFPSLGGASISLYYLIKGLDKNIIQPIIVLPEKGNIFNLFAKLEAKIEIIHQRVFMHSYNYVKLYQLKKLLMQIFATRYNEKLYNFLIKEKPDIIHLNSVSLISAAKSAKKAGVPIIWHVREMISPGYFGLRRLYLLNKIQKIADKIICISEDEASQFPNINKVNIIYNSFDPRELKDQLEKREEIKNKYNVNPNSFKFCHVGYISKAKGSFDFLKAAKKALQNTKGKYLEFYVVGNKSDELPFLKRNARKFGLPLKTAYEKALKIIKPLNIHFKFVGFEENIYAFMSLMDVIVFNSNLRAFGRPIFEAQALGKIVIGANNKSLSKIITHGKDGYIVRPQDINTLAATMISILCTMDSKIGIEAEKRAINEHDIYKQAKRVERIYLELMGRII